MRRLWAGIFLWRQRERATMMDSSVSNAYCREKGYTSVTRNVMGRAESQIVSETISWLEDLHRASSCVSWIN